MKKVDLKKRFQEARQHPQIKKLNFFNRLLLRLLLHTTELIYNRLYKTHTVGCIFYEKDMSPKARRKQMHVIKEKKDE